MGTKEDDISSFLSPAQIPCSDSKLEESLGYKIDLTQEKAETPDSNERQ